MANQYFYITFLYHMSSQLYQCAMFNYRDFVFLSKMLIVNVPIIIDPFTKEFNIVKSALIRLLFNQLVVR